MMEGSRSAGEQSATLNGGCMVIDKFRVSSNVGTHVISSHGSCQNLGLISRQNSSGAPSETPHYQSLAVCDGIVVLLEAKTINQYGSYCQSSVHVDTAKEGPTVVSRSLIVSYIIVVPLSTLKPQTSLRLWTLWQSCCWTAVDHNASSQRGCGRCRTDQKQPQEADTATQELPGFW
jgi:hypothetical protein